MIEAWIRALEASAPAVFLRGSVWAYPLVNAGHLLGIALLVGAIVPLDLRLLGFGRSPLGPLWRLLTRTSGLGLGIAMICGSLLFITRATEYADSRLFTAKMGIVGIGILNALVLQSVISDERLGAWSAASGLPKAVRLGAGLSLTAWPTALILGRLVGYF